MSGGNHLDIMLAGPARIDVPAELYCPRTGLPCERAIGYVTMLPGLENDAPVLEALEKVVDKCDVDESRLCALGQSAIDNRILTSAGRGEL